MSDDNAPRSGAFTLGAVGAPSTTGSVEMTLFKDAYGTPVHGRMVTFEQDMTDPHSGHVTRERALGTITEVETVNPTQSARSPQAVHNANQRGAQRSGDDHDTRSVSVGVESVFRHDDAEVAAPGAHTWKPAGATLSNSPATGTPVQLVDQRVVDGLMVGVGNQRWLGTLRGSTTTVPWTMRDFTGSRGAWHGVVAGATGSGKSGAATYVAACDLFYPSLGVVVLDPQAQWATEAGMVFSYQGLARSLGRTVTVARLSRTLRLRKDAAMFTELLARVDLFRELSFGAGSADQIAAASTVFADALEDKKALHAATGTRDWTEAEAGDLLAYLLEDLRDTLPTGTVYAGRDGQDRVRYAIRKPTWEEIEESGGDPATARAHRDGILDERHDGGNRWRKVLSRFAPIHNMWSPYTPEGAAQIATGTTPADLPEHQRRRSAWALLSQVFAHDPSRPAPVLILDLSADVDAALLSADDEDGETLAALEDARKALDHPGVKARIMRQLLGDLERAGMAAFKAGSALNVRIWVDEAWQFCGPIDASTDKDVARLGDAFENGVRDLRKLGIGLTFILQSVSGLREGIWKQTSVRLIGYGLTEGSDLKRLANVVGDQHLRLYASTAGPEATGRYPFMVAGGGATGLSFGTKPVFLDMLTDPAQFLTLNRDWISAQRRQYLHLLPDGDRGGELTTMPARPVGDAYMEGVRHAQGLRKGAANADAAKRLTAGAARTKQSFGMTPKAILPGTDGPPPF